MTDEQPPTSFWKSVPGVLTALAGLVSAVAALLLAFNALTDGNGPDQTAATLAAADTSTTATAPVTTVSAPTSQTEDETTTTTTTTTTVEPPLLQGALTLTNQRGQRSLADVDRGLTYQVDISTSLAHYEEIDIALHQTIELLIYGGVANNEGRGVPRFVVQTRNEPGREDCDEVIAEATSADDLRDIILYSGIYSSQTGVGEWVCLLTTEGRIGAFRVAEEYDGSQLVIDYIVWE